GGVVPPEMSIVRPILARRQGADDGGGALSAGFIYKLLQIPAESVDAICFAGPHDILGLRTNAFAAGAAVIIRPELHDDEVTLVDLRPQVLPEETGVKAAAAGAAKSAVDHVDFFRIEICHQRRAPAPLVHVGAVAQRAVAHR